MSAAVFFPTKGESSSTVAFAIRSIEPNCRRSFIFRLSPTPGISESSEVKSRFLAAFAVKFDRRLMRFFADLQDQPERKRVAVERDRPVFAAVDEQVRDLVVLFRRFDEADEHYLLEIERLHRGGRRRQLAFAAVDEDQSRQLSPSSSSRL